MTDPTQKAPALPAPPTYTHTQVKALIDGISADAATYGLEVVDHCNGTMGLRSREPALPPDEPVAPLQSIVERIIRRLAPVELSVRDGRVGLDRSDPGAWAVSIAGGTQEQVRELLNMAEVVAEELRPLYTRAALPADSSQGDSTERCGSVDAAAPSEVEPADPGSRAVCKALIRFYQTWLHNHPAER